MLRDTEFQDEPVRYSWESTPSLDASESVEAQETETDGSGGERRGDMLAGQQETLKPITNEAFVTRLHSAIRWNRSKEKWTTLLDEREDACNLVDQRNGNTALHLAAQVCCCRPFRV